MRRTGIDQVVTQRMISYKGKAPHARKGDVREDFSEEMILKLRIKTGVNALKEWRKNVSERRKSLWKIREAGRCRAQSET